MRRFTFMSTFFAVLAAITWIVGGIVFLVLASKMFWIGLVTLVSFVICGMFSMALSKVLANQEDILSNQRRMLDAIRRNNSSGEKPNPDTTRGATRIRSLSERFSDDNTIWVCSKCGERNPISNSSCKSCGHYK